jgi:hypothetical protein
MIFAYRIVSRLGREPAAETPPGRKAEAAAEA